MSKIEDLEEIKQLKARYFYHLDRKEWDAWEQVFAPDALLDVSGEHPDAPDPSQHIVHGAAAIRDMVARVLEGTVTVHHGHMPMISLETDERATGVWAMEDQLFYADGARMTGYGHYHEEYRRVDGRWRIAKCKLTRLKRIRF